MAARARDRMTFGEIVEDGGVREQASRVTRDVIVRSNAEAIEVARVHLYVISCDTCTAPACCSCTTTAYLYEVLPIAARLVRERRDTPVLRKQLRDAADEMESTAVDDYSRPCVFLDGAGRCSVYDDRPSACGTHLVSSPAELCGTRGADVVAIRAPLQDTVPPRAAVDIATSLGLEHIGTQYFGMMPRMVLLCLEAWARPDYVRFLAKHGRSAAERFAYIAAMNDSRHLLTAIKTWAAVAWADGKLVEAERVTMKAIIAAAKISDEERTIASTYLDEPVKLADLNLDRIPVSERVHIYSVACGVSAMDKDVAAAERVFLDKLATALGLSAEDAKKARAGAGL